MDRSRIIRPIRVAVSALFFSLGLVVAVLWVRCYSIIDMFWGPTTTSGQVEVSTCGLMTLGSDTRIAIYDGAGCPTASAIACIPVSSAFSCPFGFVAS